MMRNLYEEGISLVCAMEKHDECVREDCACICHGLGGVREPRRPKPNQPHLFATGV